MSVEVIGDVALETTIVTDITFNDNIRLLFGTGDDSSIVFDATRLIIEPGYGSGTAIDVPLRLLSQVASSSTAGMTLELVSDDGAALGSGHQLGQIDFVAAEDGSSTLVTGARIEALSDAVWSGTENGTDLVFLVNNGNDSLTEVARMAADGLLALGGVTPVAGVRLLLPQENDAVTPTVAFGNGSSGIYESSDNVISFAIAGTATWRFSATILGTVASGRVIMLDEAPSATNPVLIPASNDLDTGIGHNAADQLSLIAGAHEMLRLTEDVVTDDLTTALFDAPDMTVTSDATTSAHMVGIQARTHNFNGGVNITTPIDGIALNLPAQVVASDSAVVITQLSSLYVAASDTSDAEVTVTTNLAAEFDGAILITTGTLTASGGGSLTGTWTDLGSVTTVDINGGTIDGNTIGGSSAAAGTFTAIIGTTITGSGILSIDDTTESTSTITGSIHTDGGLGVAGSLFIGGVINYGAETDLTIATGAVAITTSYHSIVVEGGAGSGADILATATGGVEGDILILKANTSGANDQITVQDGTGSNTFILAGGADFVMDHLDDRLVLLHNGTEWVELSRSSNS